MIGKFLGSLEWPKGAWKSLQRVAWLGHLSLKPLLTQGCITGVGNSCGEEEGLTDSRMISMFIFHWGKL